ncbi:MAG: hypothetical protein JWN33_67 [Candidatus Saccharibacteria bacterium]|nr:hypothetical protein [Candidatus Saccharibacteria bacterium]
MSRTRKQLATIFRKRTLKPYRRNEERRELHQLASF